MDSRKLIFVRPRVTTEFSSEPILLVDALRAIDEVGKSRLVAIVGAPDSGKTAAIEYLLMVKPIKNVVYCDNPSEKSVGELLARHHRMIVFTTRELDSPFKPTKLFLAPWSRDECYEYAKQVSETGADSVIRRLGEDVEDLLRGNPCACRWVIDQMIDDEAMESCRTVFAQKVLSARKQNSWRDSLDLLCWKRLLGVSNESHRDRNPFWWTLTEEIKMLCTLPAFSSMVLGQHLAEKLRQNENTPHEASALPIEVVECTVDYLRDNPCIPTLKSWVTKSTGLAGGFALSVLHQLGYDKTIRECIGANAGWFKSKLDISGAFLGAVQLRSLSLDKLVLNYASSNEAILEQIKLTNCQADAIDFTEAQLRDCEILQSQFPQSDWEKAQIFDCFVRHSNFKEAEFPGAVVRSSLFRESTFCKADFSDGDFFGCKFRDCDFLEAKTSRAIFSNCEFQRSILQKVDFQHGQWNGAKFPNCNLRSANFEGVGWDSSDFSGAILSKANMSGTGFRGGNFQKAGLQGAKLARIDWEGANLRHADLTGAQFHLGTTRSGLVGSVIASEGTRTGFYTDDFLDQGFKAPDEIRVANLRGADLRGARLDGVDLYLVDLRDARLDPEHLKHARRCKAIL